MAYTTIKKPSSYFNTNLYTGNNTETSHTVGFQPDFTWLKVRNAVGSHYLFDSVRLATKYIQANTTSTEGTDANTLKSFDANGYTVGTSNAVNTNNETMVGWNWLANGTGVANTDGSISSTVSANTTSGFSIVTWSGSGTTGTIGHGLGTEPSVIIPKCRTQIADWYSYWKPLGNGNAVRLNTPDVSASTGIWNNTSPTSSVFSVVNNTVVNQSGHTYVAYCFAEKTGFSKFGSYFGNSSADGAFIYTGMKPSFVIIKNIDAAESWSMFDGKRPDSNQTNGLYQLQPNTSSAEYQGAPLIDFVSNGFKLRTSTNSLNVAQNYIYMAFAEQPLVGDNPATAR